MKVDKGLLKLIRKEDIVIMLARLRNNAGAKDIMVHIPLDYTKSLLEDYPMVEDLEVDFSLENEDFSKLAVDFDKREVKKNMKKNNELEKVIKPVLWGKEWLEPVVGKWYSSRLIIKPEGVKLVLKGEITIINNKHNEEK